MSAGTSLAASFSQFFALRFLLGVGESVVTPASMRWIRFHFPEKQRGLAVGLYMTGTKIGPADRRVDRRQADPRLGWKTMFAVLGLGSLLWLIPWLTLVKDDDRQIEEAGQPGGPQTSVSFGRLMASPVIWGTIIGTFCYMYFVYFCMTWMPAYFVERRHLSLDSMGLYSCSVSAAWPLWRRWEAGSPTDDRARRRSGERAQGVHHRGFVIASTEVFGALSDSFRWRCSSPCSRSAGWAWRRRTTGR